MTGARIGVRRGAPARRRKQVEYITISQLHRLGTCVAPRRITDASWEGHETEPSDLSRVAWRDVD
jgi:hypothetical protein